MSSRRFTKIRDPVRLLKVSRARQSYENGGACKRLFLRGLRALERDGSSGTWACRRLAADPGGSARLAGC